MVKVKPIQLGKTERMTFSQIDEVVEMPNLIEVQKNSYKWFLERGLKEVFRDISTIEDYTGNLVLLSSTVPSALSFLSLCVPRVSTLISVMTKLVKSCTPPP